MAAMVASLRWRTQGAWNMFVGDRRGACLPLEGGLRSIIRLMATAWIGSSVIPRWKADQMLHPGAWEVRMVLDPDPKPKWMSRISFDQHGLVGVDLKSHRTSTAIPYPVITEGERRTGHLL